MRGDDHWVLNGMKMWITNANLTDVAVVWAWGAVGAAADCYDTALRYAGQREQFDKPIASFQLVQQKLVHMLTEITEIPAFR